MATDSRQFLFGPGVAWAKIAQYLDGTIPDAYVQPTRFDILQDLSIDFSFTAKELFGTQVFPDAIGIGNTKLTGKVRSARLNAQSLVSAAFGYADQPGTGVSLMAISEKHTPNPIVTVTHNTVWTYDWGVRYADSGLYLTPVGSGSEDTGKYSVANGVYTFDTSDEVALLFDYEYTLATGKTVAITNFQQGQITLYGLRYQGVFRGGSVGLWIPNAVSSKFTLNPKQQDFTLPEFDFSAFASADGTVASLYTTE